MILLVSVLMSCAEKKPGAEDAAVVETDSLRSADSVAGAENLDDELETHAGIYDVRDVERYWQKRTIQVAGDKNDIVGLFEAFNAVWPTKEGNSIVRATNPSLVQGDYYPGKPIIDRKHGFVESPYGERMDTSSLLCMGGCMTMTFKILLSFTTTTQPRSSSRPRRVH